MLTTGLLLRLKHTDCLILRKLNVCRSFPWIGRVMVAVSRLGNGACWYALLVAIAVSGAPGSPMTVARMVASGLTLAALYHVLKERIGRRRPSECLEDVQVLIAPLDRFSFPSGHTMHAVSFSILAASGFPMLTPALVSFTFLVMLSRVVLGLHFASDVAAGACLGGLSALATLAVLS